MKKILSILIALSLLIPQTVGAFSLFNWDAFSTSTPAYGRVLMYDGLKLIFQATSSLGITGGGGGTPGGSDTQIQYNNAGSFGGANMFYDNVGDFFNVGGTPTYTDTDLSIMNFVRDVDDYAFIGAQNINSGASSSISFVVANASTTDTIYGEFGINSPHYNLPEYGQQNVPSAVFMTSNGVPLILNAAADCPDGYIKMTTGGFTDDAIFVSCDGKIGIGTSTPATAFQINSGASERTNLSLSSTNLAQPFTNFASTTIFALLNQNNLTTGGLQVTGISSGTTGQPLTVSGYHGGNPADGLPSITFSGARNLGGVSLATLNDAEMIAMFSNLTAPKVRIFASGDIMSTGDLMAQRLLATTTTGVSSFMHNVGIGTTSPYSKLSVVGTVVASNFVGTSTATSTLGGPVNIPTGSCYAINDVCQSASGSTVTSYFTSTFQETYTQLTAIPVSAGSVITVTAVGHKSNTCNGVSQFGPFTLLVKPTTMAATSSVDVRQVISGDANNSCNGTITYMYTATTTDTVNFATTANNVAGGATTTISAIKIN